MTYKDMYNDMLDEIYQELVDNAPSWMTKYGSASRTMEENDPIMYRCGFCDWLDGLDDARCDECGDGFKPEKDYVDMDDDVICTVCKGEQFKCEGCDELFDLDEPDQTLCSACQQEESEVKMEMAADLCM